VSQDVLHRFSFRSAPIRGQWVRLDAVLDQLFERRDYPAAVRTLLAEMMAAVSLMADSIKFRGAVALQSTGSGPVTTALAECRDKRMLRGIARWRETVTDSGLDPQPSYGELSSLIGEGRMAISLIARGESAASADGNSYQGVISIAEGDLARNLEDYFANSEQLPTRLFFTVWDSTVTGLLLQRLPAPDTATEIELDHQANLWREVELLASTLRPEELGQLPADVLLRRLFHEHPVTLQPGRELAFSCTCSRERAESMLQALPKEELLELLETQGLVDVTCEVCGARYEYDKLATHLLYEPGDQTLH
jgi:molecular chaperone Hsp33